MSFILLATASCQQFDLFDGAKKKPDKYSERGDTPQRRYESRESQDNNDDTSRAVQNIEHDQYDDLETRNKTKLYEVLATDTLRSIAKKYHVSEAEIIRANDLEHPYELRPGQIIKIPAIEYYKPNLNDEVESLDKPKKRSAKEIYIVPKKR